MTSPEKPLILAIDDSPLNLDILKEYLAREGFRVIAFHRGSDALDHVKLEKPDLILLDITMPEMDGYQVCEQLKRDEATAPIPVIFVSALNDAADKVKAFDSGGIDFIVKPFQFEDLTRRIRNHLIISQQRRMLEEQNLLKDRFMKIAAHDLRNPLMGIMTNAELLELDFPEVMKDQDAAEVVKEIRRSAQAMEEIINDFLDVQALNNEAHFETCQFNPVPIIDQVVNQNKSIAARKNISIQLITESPRPLVEANPSRLHQVATNYISNAVKYSPKGSHVEVFINNGERFRLEVHDQGPGIPEEERPLLFKEFRSLSTQPTGGEKSVGLGLWAVHSLAGAMGGKVGALFPSNGGSIFWFELPLCELS